MQPKEALGWVRAKTVFAVCWEHWECTGRALKPVLGVPCELWGMYWGAWDPHREYAGAELRALGPILGALGALGVTLGVHWSCTQSFRAHIRAHTGNARSTLGVFGSILGSYLESCSPCWHCTGNTSSMLGMFGLILGS